MELNSLIAECTAYDFKLMLEEKKPKSWLKSVSAFANGLGSSLFFDIDNDNVVKGLDDIQNVMTQLDYMEKRGFGLTRICNETKALEGYKYELKPVFKSTPTQFRPSSMQLPTHRMSETMTETCRRRNSLSVSRKYSISSRIPRQ